MSDLSKVMEVLSNASIKTDVVKEHNGPGVLAKTGVGATIAFSFTDREELVGVERQEPSKDLEAFRAMLNRAGVDYDLVAWGPPDGPPNSWRVVIRRGGRFFVSFNADGTIEGKRTIGVIG